MQRESQLKKWPKAKKEAIISGKLMSYKKHDFKPGVDFIGVTCVFYCHDGKGNLLMHKRSKNCRDEKGRWDCGGGAMELGETFETAAKREIKEEYCCDVLDLKFVTATNVLRKNDKEDTHWIALLFAILVDPKKVKLGDPEKMDEIGWFPFDKLPSPLHSQLINHFNLVKDSLKAS